MTDQGMRFTKNFLLGVIRQTQKHFVSIGNMTLKVGLANNQLFWLEMAFLAGWLDARMFGQVQRITLLCLQILRALQQGHPV